MFEQKPPKLACIPSHPTIHPSILPFNYAAPSLVDFYQRPRGEK